VVLYLLKNIGRALTGIGIAFVVSVGLGTIDAWLLDHFALVYPAGDLDIATWLDSFKNALWFGTIAALSVAVVWDLMALFSSGRRSDRRHWWEILFLLATGAAGWIAFNLPLPSQSAVWPTVLGGSQGTLCFLVATIPFTPDSLKYSPWLAHALRLRSTV
jgi:hypothetical protein